jgi:acetyl esterase
MLLYPITDHPSANHPSYTENASGYGLDAHLMRWFWEQRWMKKPRFSMLN